MERITRKPTVATDEHHQNRGGWGVAREVGRQNFNAISKSSQSLRRRGPGRGVLVEPDQTQARETLQQQGAMAATPEGGIDQHPVLMGLADLGVSSPQLDVAERGFSFRLDGPLDMRMNPGSDAETAAELIDRLEENALADLIYGYGEERLSRRIARRIKADLVAQGPYGGTAALAYAVAGCYPPKARRGRIHPATRTFQALRIAVNDELGVLDRLLEQAPGWLEPEGVLGIISFHSLEDRRVKAAFLRDERLQRITRKPLVATPEEEERNPRSRSAKWRLARRVNGC